MLRVKEREKTPTTLKSPDQRLPFARVRGGKKKSLNFKSKLEFFTIAWGEHSWLLNCNCVFLSKVIVVIFFSL